MWQAGDSGGVWNPAETGGLMGWGIISDFWGRDLALISTSNGPDP
jgi:hypothetical protein